MPAALPEHAKTWLDGPNFVTLATINPDGQPQLSTMWVARDGDDVLFATVVGRQKERNLRRDPRATVLLPDPENGYRYVEVRGTVTLDESRGRALIDDLHEKYRGSRPYPADGPDDVRVEVRVTPTKVVRFG